MWPRSPWVRGRALADKRAGIGEICVLNHHLLGRPPASGRPESNKIGSQHREQRGRTPALKKTTSG